MSGEPAKLHDLADYRTGLFEILLIEDAPSDARLIERFATERPGYRVHVVGSGHEALDFLYRRGRFAAAPFPRLIILDWNLPGTSGGELLECIKEDSRLHSIPVVILSSSSADESVLEAYNLHANCWVVKSLELEDQARRIRSLVDFWSRTAELPRSLGA